MQYYLSLISTVLLFFQGVSGFSQDLIPGHIYFSNSPLTKQGISKANIIKESTLHPKTDLYIHLVLDRPLSHSLQNLAPGMDRKTVAKSGNFQFLFLVDDSLIYTTNLIPGAPSTGIKDTATKLSLPLIKYNNEEGALWSQYAWFRFFYNGGGTALTEGKHRLKIIVRPYIKINSDLQVGENIAPTSYQLAEVYWDRVVLRQSNGTTRELQFKGMENGLDQSIIPPVATNSLPMNNQTTPPMPSQEQNALGQAVQKIQEHRDQYLKGMGVNAASGGYEVTARTPAALRSKLGLQPGDRIMSLNGQAVGQGQSDAQLLEQARREGQVKIEIKRGDQVMTIQQNF